MGRPHCWVFGKRLMYVNGKPVHAVIVDPIGVEHKAHKECAKWEKQEQDRTKTSDFNAWTRRT